MEEAKLHRLNDVLNAPKRMRSLVILNGSPVDFELLTLVWPKPLEHEENVPVICADGGANILYDAIEAHALRAKLPPGEAEQKWIPSHIVGDLDSIRQDVRQFYESQGTKVIQRASEYSNDFQKALDVENSLVVNNHFPTLVIGGYAGRMDQTLGNLNTLYCCAQADHDAYWLDTSNVVLILGAGRHHISIDPSREGPMCGLIPIGQPVRSITTSGLKWNLDCQKLSFGTGGLVSTSNEVVEPIVFVETSDPIAWTSSMRLF